MADLIQDILDNLDIVDIVSRYVKLKKVGRNFVGLCPFHREKTPSFSVAQDKQIFKCFGCGAGGNLIKFYMDIEKVDFQEALKDLAKEAKLDLSKYKQTSTKADLQKIDEKDTILNINKQAMLWFQDQLKNTPSALDYIKNERKLSESAINRFGIGYTNDSNIMLIKFLIGKGFKIEDIGKTGLISKSNDGNFYSFFRNRIIFPIFDVNGNVVGFSGRILDPQDMPKYLNIPETLVYEKSKILYGLNIAKNYIKEFDKIIVVEGYMDVIGLSRLGINVGVATCGTALTQYHIMTLKRYTNNIVFCFDSDEAGITATFRALKIAYENDVYPKILKFNQDFKDIDELANFFEGKTFDNSIFEYIDGFDYVFEILKSRYDITNIIERKKFFAEIFEIIRYISSNIDRAVFFEKIAKNLKMQSTIINNMFNSYIKTNKRYIDTKPENQNKIDEKYIFGSLFYNDFLAKNDIELDLNDVFDIFNKIGAFYDDFFVSKVLGNNLDLEEKDFILQAQMIWEKQFEGLTKEKKILEISRYIKHMLSKLSQMIAKSDKIDQNTKHEIISMIKNIILKR